MKRDEMKMAACLVTIKDSDRSATDWRLNPASTFTTGSQNVSEFDRSSRTADGVLGVFDYFT